MAEPRFPFLRLMLRCVKASRTCQKTSMPTTNQMPTRNSHTMRKTKHKPCWTPPNRAQDFWSSVERRVLSSPFYPVLFECDAVQFSLDMSTPWNNSSILLKIPKWSK